MQPKVEERVSLLNWTWPSPRLVIEKSGWGRSQASTWPTLRTVFSNSPHSSLLPVTVSEIVYCPSVS